MKKNRMMQELNRELDGVRVSRDLKQRILADAAVSRAPSRRKSFSIRPLAIAAAVMVVCGLTAGMIALRQEKPDLSATTLSASKIKTTQDMVWVRLPEGLYHAKSDCEKVQDPISMPLDSARSAGLKGCSSCIESGSSIAEGLVWMVQEGSVYHEVPDCSGMEDPLGVLEIEAQTLGKQACGICMGGDLVETWPQPAMSTLEPKQEMLATLPPMETAMPTPVVTAEPTPTPMPTEQPMSEINSEKDSQVWITSTESDADEPEEIYVWATPNGVFYHVNEDCSGMRNAEYVLQNEAIESGKMRCAVCMKNTVWVSDENAYYHIARYCSGMKDAVTTTEQEALDVNKSACPACIEEMDAETETAETVSEAVWVHPDDELYYHSDAYCGSNVFTAAEVRQQVKAACAVCAENVEDDDFVWTNHDNHFHLDKYCSERPFYVSCSESDAIESGRMPCVLCMNGETEAVDFDCFVWTTESAALYHRAQNCSGMKNARQTGKDGAENEGKQSCSVCMDEIPVWIEDGAYYHMHKGCSGVLMQAQVAESVAAKDGKQPCPICCTEEALIPWRTAVWITEDYFYHADEHCSEIIMLSDYKECCFEANAVEFGKVPCEKCLAQRYVVAEETEQSDCVWITEGGAYYHTLSKCMGLTNAYGCDVVEALEKGKKPCEVCAKQILHYDSEAVSETVA